VSSKPGQLSVLYIQRMYIIIVDFIKIRNKNSVNKVNLSLALCTHNFSPKIRLDYAYKYILNS